MALFAVLYKFPSTKYALNLLKKTYIVALFFTIIFSSNATFAKISYKDVTAIENYLNQIKTIKANFKQIGPEENMERQGVFYIAKPGKIKWQYLSPNKITIISNQNKVSYYDHELEEMTKVDQDHTLAQLLTTPHINLKDTVNIISIINHDHELELIASKKSSETHLEHYPYLILKFKKKPNLEISQIMIVNDEFSFSEIIFSKLEINKSLDDSLFQFKDPKFFELRDN